MLLNVYICVYLRAESKHQRNSYRDAEVEKGLYFFLFGAYDSKH